MSFFKKIFGRKPVRRQNDQAFYDPSNAHDRVGLALLGMLRPQLDLCGFELEHVPDIPPFNGPKCRGALIGISEGILVGEGVERTADNIYDTVIAAFALTFSDAVGRDMSLRTVNEAQAGNEEVNAAIEWAIEDTVGVYKSGGLSSAGSFYLAAMDMI
ncbi:hypothetical protein [Sphingobium sp. UBA5915]|uniref:hypothetical protein n=1 Tax=Sphingobium sp. UBA5915 TaxID=1947530 RepID=UPI0025E21BD3|nr:hypothetical protein [Sphingobium sp. UBA5915]